MRHLLHALGFHGGNWQPYWFMGNVWTRCTVCGARRMLPFDAISEMPEGAYIEPEEGR